MAKAKYMTVVTSILTMESDDDLKEYIEEQKARWNDDQPEQIKNLAENGFCQLEDEWGRTMIVVRRVDE